MFAFSQKVPPILGLHFQSAGGKNSNGRHLRCLAGLLVVRTGGSHDDTDVDRLLLIAVLATSDELELSVYLLWFVQETLEKNIGCVLLQHLLRKPQQVHA